MPRGPVKKIEQKTSEKDEALLRRLASANPYRKESFSDYAASEEARRAFARLLACEAESVRPAARPQKVRGARLVWIGATAVLIVAAIVLSVVDLGARATPSQVAVTAGPLTTAAAAEASPTSTELASGATGPVTRGAYSRPPARR